MRRALGLVVALPAEERCLLGPGRGRQREGVVIRRCRLHDGTPLICARRGVGLQNADVASRRVIAEGAAGLASLGVSGGLEQGLKPGDLILADRVTEKDIHGERVEFEPDRACVDLAHGALKKEGMPVYRGAIFSARQALLTVGEKKSLCSRSRLLAADMESAAVGRAAGEAGLPCFILRAVCDPVERSVDSDLFSCLGEDGRILWSSLLDKLARRPSLLGSLLRTRRDFLLALDSLHNAWRIQVRIGLPKQLLSR
jgi:nucleoside phosphorylase